MHADFKARTWRTAEGKSTEPPAAHDGVVTAKLGKRTIDKVREHPHYACARCEEDLFLLMADGKVICGTCDGLAENLCAGATRAPETTA